MHSKQNKNFQLFPKPCCSEEMFINWGLSEKTIRPVTLHNLFIVRIWRYIRELIRHFSRQTNVNYTKSYILSIITPPIEELASEEQKCFKFKKCNRISLILSYFA